MTNRQFRSYQALPEEYEAFLAKMEAFMRNIKQLSDSSIHIYLNRIRQLIMSGYSVADLCGAPDRLWEELGPNGTRYDPKDHGNTRAAVRHLDDYVRMALLEEYSSLHVSYEQGWQSFRPVEKYESGYIIQDGMIIFSYNKGFSKCKTVKKRSPPVI